MPAQLTTKYHILFTFFHITCMKPCHHEPGFQELQFLGCTVIIETIQWLYIIDTCIHTHLYTYAWKENAWVSLHLPFKSSLQEFLSPPCGRTAEYLLPLVKMKSMEPFLNINNDKIHDNYLGKWPTMKLSFKTVDAYLSLSRIQWLPLTNTRYLNFMHATYTKLKFLENLTQYTLLPMKIYDMYSNAKRVFRCTENDFLAKFLHIYFVINCKFQGISIYKWIILTYVFHFYSEMVNSSN